jgi:MFS family permease
MRWSVLRNRDLRILMGGQVIDMFGSTALVIVLGIWVKDLTGSDGAAGLIFFVLALSSLAAPLTGLVVDRFPRRLVLLVNDLVAAALVTALLLVHDRGDVWLIYLVALVYGASGQISRAARGGLLHSMLAADQLGEANGLFSSVGQGLRIIGPLVGAAIYAGAGASTVALMDLTTFLLSAATFLLLRHVPDLVRAERGTGSGAAGSGRPSLGTELIAGTRHVLSEPIIRGLVLASTAAFAGAGLINVAMFKLVDQGLHRPTAIIGALGAAQGAGSVLAGLAVGAILRRLGEYSTATVGFLLNGAGLVAASTAVLPGVIAGALLVGFGLPLILVAEITVVQRRTEGELQGRAITASEAIIGMPFAIAIAVGSAVIASVGFRPIYLAVAAGFTVAGLVLFPFRAATRPERADPAATLQPTGAD